MTALRTSVSGFGSRTSRTMDDDRRLSLWSMLTLLVETGRPCNAHEIQQASLREAIDSTLGQHLVSDGR